ncbi:MAG: [protein-PII] uridylyltransferase [Gammaproteobacteria bacterium]
MPNNLSELPAAATFPAWFGLAALDAGLASGDKPLPLFRECLQEGNTTLIRHFEDATSADLLISARSWLVDQVLMRTWERFMGSAGDSLALVAVGGYGRGELMPGSDIDLQILLPDGDSGQHNPAIEALVTFLWDIGLEVGHSVRTIEDCIEQSLADITVATNLMEARLLAGSAELFQRMQQSTSPPDVWNSRDFFEVKLEEQRTRHHRFHDTAAKLEPNVKEGPGGLRDIQMIAWIAKRHLGTGLLDELVEHGCLTTEEYQSLVAGRNYLWQIRFALHALTGRGEDRLMFDYQRTLAKTFGFEDNDTRLGVEAFMKQYYCTIMELKRLNEMLMQMFHEKILYPEGPGQPRILNRRFQSRNNFLEVSDPQVFRHYPFALLEMFLLLEQNPELEGVRADTIRLIREHIYLIDEKFRSDIRCRSLFMEIIRQPHGITRELRRMNSYGVLAAYLPAFNHIVGLMQYDLFHIYTVDEHILFVVRNLRRFINPEYAYEFPLCHHVIGTLPKPELLCLAGLFHDIAKGRGGDHSNLGGAYARDFCQRHDLSNYDTELVVWLVNQHLLMSSTAQREDISDPLVVNRFAKVVDNPVRLDYLYLLTVADIRATNPELWNSWKDSLLKQLYHNTRGAIQLGLKDPVERSEYIRQNQEAAAVLLHEPAESYAELWKQLGDEYFFRSLPWQIAHHTRLITHNPGDNLVELQSIAERGGTEVFIYAVHADDLFSRVTAVLNQQGLNVVSAVIISTKDGHILATFHVLEESGDMVEGRLRTSEIETALLREINTTTRGEWHISRRTPRQYRHFPIKTHISFKTDEHDQHTIMELITADRPGLLSLVGRAFAECKIKLLNARIVTFGSRAEDIYYITDQNDRPLGKPEQFERLEQAITKHLEARTEQTDMII